MALPDLNGGLVGPFRLVQRAGGGEERNEQREDLVPGGLLELAEKVAAILGRSRIAALLEDELDVRCGSIVAARTSAI